MIKCAKIFYAKTISISWDTLNEKQNLNTISYEINQPFLHNASVQTFCPHFLLLMFIVLSPLETVICTFDEFIFKYFKLFYINNNN